MSAAGGGPHDLRLLDALYAQPLVNASWVGDHLGVAPTTANKMLERFADAGILRETTGKKRYRVYRYTPTSSSSKHRHTRAALPTKRLHERGRNLHLGHQAPPGTPHRVPVLDM